MLKNNAILADTSVTSLYSTFTRQDTSRRPSMDSERSTISLATSFDTKHMRICQAGATLGFFDWFGYGILFGAGLYLIGAITHELSEYGVARARTRAGWYTTIFFTILITYIALRAGYYLFQAIPRLRRFSTALWHLCNSTLGRPVALFMWGAPVGMAFVGCCILVMMYIEELPRRRGDSFERRGWEVATTSFKLCVFMLVIRALFRYFI